MPKVCKICVAEKPLSEFYADARYRDGHSGGCKACLRARWRRGRKEYRDAHGRDRGRDNAKQRQRRKLGGAAYKARYYLKTGVWPFDRPVRPEHEKDWKAALKAVKNE